MAALQCERCATYQIEILESWMSHQPMKAVQQYG
jgi:hypothetical protein